MPKIANTIGTEADSRSLAYWTPEQLMLCRMLDDAVRAVALGRAEDRAWVAASEPVTQNPEGFSFTEVCQYLYLEAEHVRGMIL